METKEKGIVTFRKCSGERVLGGNTSANNERLLKSGREAVTPRHSWHLLECLLGLLSVPSLPSQTMVTETGDKVLVFLLPLCISQLHVRILAAVYISGDTILHLTAYLCGSRTLVYVFSYGIY